MKKNPASENGTQSRSRVAAEADGAVVDMVKVETVPWFPAGICGGLKMQVVKGGRDEQKKVTGLAKLPLSGTTSTGKVKVPPGGTDVVVGGVTSRQKSELAVTVNPICWLSLTPLEVAVTVTV